MLTHDSAPVTVSELTVNGDDDKPASETDGSIFRHHLGVRGMKALLHNRRKRLADLEAREAAGESFWTEEFERPARVKFVHAYRYATGEVPEYGALARDAILQNEGEFFLYKDRMPPADDLINYLLRCDDEMVPTVVEAMSTSCADRGLNAALANWDRSATFDPSINVILREHRISYELTSNQMVPFSSKELHEAVVSPTLKLLTGRPDLHKVEFAYRSALEEISAGKPANAITDAGTALQETLSALGCSGNALGPLITSARQKGILAPHDSPMLSTVEKILHWVSADRSETGDAHTVTSPTLDDAWFIVHVVGAAVLRLSKSEPRIK
jgi:hypothetical protein